MKSKIFYDEIRASIFDGKLNEKQVEGINAILNASHGLVISYVAYALATATLETGEMMQPIKETVQTWHKNKNPSDKEVMRRLERAFQAGKLGDIRPYWRDGWFGRGFVQLTHEDNYRKMSRYIGADLVKEPDKALTIGNAAIILIKGMYDGAFTGKRFADYLPGDYLRARQIVNGMDRAQDVADYAVAYERALRLAGYEKPIPMEFTATVTLPYSTEASSPMPYPKPSIPLTPPTRGPDRPGAPPVSSPAGKRTGLVAIGVAGVGIGAWLLGMTCSWPWLAELVNAGCGQ